MIQQYSSDRGKWGGFCLDPATKSDKVDFIFILLFFFLSVFSILLCFIQEQRLMATAAPDVAELLLQLGELQWHHPDVEDTEGDDETKGPHRGEFTGRRWQLPE